jgi:signal transduction histidine kinase
MNRPPSPRAVTPMPSFGAYLVIVMLVATLPLVLMLALQLFDDMQSQQRRLNDNLQRSATALASSVERELAATVDMLTSLSRSLRAQGERLSALRRALEAEPQRPDWRSIYLRGADGRLLFHSAGGQVPQSAGRDGRPAGRPADAAPAAISDLVADQARLGTVVELPFVSDDGARYTLGAWIDASHWQRLVESGAPEQGYLGIVGRDRRLIARSDAPTLVGHALPVATSEAMAEAIGDRAAAAQRFELPEGVMAYGAWRGLAASGWAVGAGMYAEPIDSAQRGAVLAALATTTTCLLLGVGLAALLARRVTTPLRQLASGGPSLSARPVVREIALLHDALASAQAQEIRSRANLQRKADEFQALFAGTPVGLAFMPDRRSNHVLRNAAMEELVGAAGDPSSYEPLLQRAADSGEALGPLELELRSLQGRIRHVLVRVVPLIDRDQRTRGAVAAMVDLTERKLAEQRLLEADNRLRESQNLIDLAQDAGDVGFFQYRFDSRTGTWTPGQARLFGFDSAQPPPSPEALLAHIQADDRPMVQAQLEAMIETAQERATIEFRVQPPGAEPRWLSSRVMLAFDAEGRPHQLVGVSLNVTEHKRAERERAALVEREQAARLLAESASRAKDEFLAMLGHELRNPLGAIASAVEVLNRVDGGTELAANARQIIGRQTRHLAHLMDDLLDVGRVISGKVLLSTRRLELGALVERVLATFEVTGESQGHDLHVALGQAWVEVDATRMEQVVTNLLGNAFKYTPAGRRVDVTLRSRDGNALLEVRDQGPGIPSPLLPRIFELFVQGQRPLDRPGGGLGIGLTLVRRLVELHGGKVTVDSSAAGTAFQVSLPAVEPPSRSDREATRSPLAQRRVLVVEDNPDALAAMGSMLELDGHGVSRAVDGERGLALLLEELPDAAIVDIGLPGLSGYEVARRARRAGYAGKLFALSGYSGAQDVAKAQRHGFDAHLAKPVDPQRLRELLAQP